MLGRKGGFGDTGERLKGWVSSDWIEAPLAINPDTGKLGIKRYAALSELTPDGELQFRTDGSIIQEPGSPVIAKAAVSPKVLDERVTAVAETITTLDARTTALILANTAAINAEAVTRGDADTALDGRVTALEAEAWLLDTGEDTFTIGGTTTVNTSLVNSDMAACIITIMRTNFSGMAGNWYIDNIVDDASFDITSDGLADKGTFRWWVRRKVGT